MKFTLCTHVLLQLHMGVIPCVSTIYLTTETEMMPRGMCSIKLFRAHVFNSFINISPLTAVQKCLSYSKQMFHMI